MVAPCLWAMILISHEQSSQEPPSEAGLRGQIQPYLQLAISAVIGAALSQVASALITRRPPLVYFTSMSHPLLWYRLLPNLTFKPGILVGLAITAGPLVLWLIWIFWGMEKRLNRIDSLLVVITLSGFLAVGLIISVKIGGGSNLHNLDMFLITLVLLAGVAVGRLQSSSETLPNYWPPVVCLFVLASVFIPVFWTVSTGERLKIASPALVEETLSSVKAAIEGAVQHGEVLLLDQRQLITFGHVPEVAMVWEYELVEVMDHAMASDTTYFQQFYQDLQTHRFSLIVSDPLPVVWKGKTHSFGEENDAWVSHVTVPLLEWYEPSLKLDEVGVWLLVPKSEEVN